MKNSIRSSETSSPAARADLDLEVIIKWLRGLSVAEVKELCEALATHDAEKLARFDARFEASLDHTGRS